VSGVGFLGGGVIRRPRFRRAGPATPWYSAAIGCQAAAGHCLPALGFTAIVLAGHLMLRPLRRVVDRAPVAGNDEVGSYLLTIPARRKG
jgi:putative Mg2+ transporter-C (MgtC) family protein